MQYSIKFNQRFPPFNSNYKGHYKAEKKITYAIAWKLLSSCRILNRRSFQINTRYNFFPHLITTLFKIRTRKSNGENQPVSKQFFSLIIWRGKVTKPREFTCIERSPQQIPEAKFLETWRLHTLRRCLHSPGYKHMLRYLILAVSTNNDKEYYLFTSYKSS